MRSRVLAFVVAFALAGGIGFSVSAQPYPALIQTIFTAFGYVTSSTTVVTWGKSFLFAPGTYLNFGSYTGSNGFGIREVSGDVQVKPYGGSWASLVPSGGNAPAIAAYIIKTANSSLPNAQVLGALTSGLLKVTTTTGVLSVASAGSDYLTPSGSGASLTGIVWSQIGTKPTTLSGFGITDGAPLSHVTTENAISGLVLVNGAGSYSAVTNNSSNWNTAYGWGNHASAGYLTTVTADSPLSGSGTSGSHLTVDLSGKQAAAANLTSVAALTYAAAAFVKMTGTATFGLEVGIANSDITNATATPGASKIPISDGSSHLTGWIPDMTGDSGSGGAHGLVPAPATGDATKYLQGNGTWSTPSGGGGGPAVTAVAGRTGAVVLTAADIGTGTFGGTYTFTNAITGNLTGNASGTAASITGNLSGVVTSVGMTTSISGLTDSHLATISTAGKVDNTATTATSFNTVSAIVARNGDGDFFIRDIYLRRLLPTDATFSLEFGSSNTYIWSSSEFYRTGSTRTLGDATYPWTALYLNPAGPGGTYMLTVDAVSLLVSYQAIPIDQTDRIVALESRVAQLEALLLGKGGQR